MNSPPNNKIYITGGHLNAKHQQWNITKNTNGITLKNHSEAKAYQILHFCSYSHRKPNCKLSNLDIFQTNIPYQNTIQTIDDLFSNHLPVLLQVSTNYTQKRHKNFQHTNWSLNLHKNLQLPITTKITNSKEVDSQIEHY